MGWVVGLGSGFVGSGGDCRVVGSVGSVGGGECCRVLSGVVLVLSVCVSVSNCG